jgi:hypothetical protein
VGGEPVGRKDPRGTLGIGAVIGIGIGVISGAAGAIAQNGSVADVLIAASLGGLAGGVVGLLDPTEGIGTIALTAGLLGFGTDLMGQAVTMQTKNPCDRGGIKWGSAIGAGIGSAVGASMGALMTNMALQSGGSQLLSELLSSIGLAPTALGSGIGGTFDNNYGQRGR